MKKLINREQMVREFKRIFWIPLMGAPVVGVAFAALFAHIAGLGLPFAGFWVPALLCIGIWDGVWLAVLLYLERRSKSE